MHLAPLDTHVSGTSPTFDNITPADDTRAVYGTSIMLPPLMAVETLLPEIESGCDVANMGWQSSTSNISIQHPYA